MIMDDWSRFPKLNSLFNYCEIDNDTNYFARALERGVLKLPLAQERYLQLERELSSLDEASWVQFCQKVLRYVAVSNELRGFQQLFDMFNEVKGYVFLDSQGYKNIEFIEEDNSKQTPDLIAKDFGNVTLMEVKTINNSDEEIKHIQRNSGGQGMRARDVLNYLPEPLLRKIKSTVDKASKQLLAYSPENIAINRRIVYLCIKPDVSIFLENTNLNALQDFCQSLSDERIEVTSEIVL